jgi:hypothetical protein
MTLNTIFSIVMDKSLIFGLSRHFHTEINPEMIPNLTQRAAEI